MALDAGTSSNRCIIFDNEGEIVSLAQSEFKQYYPKPGWVEHDANEILDSMLAVARETLWSSGISPDEIAAIGIANQRETTVVWDKTTGEPICQAIVWQCRRTSRYCEQLKEKGLEQVVRNKTGLMIDAYFSGTKLRWILENVQGARERADTGNLAFGTVDTWLIWKLTGGEAHVTDYSNASRTMLFDINKLEWDSEILTEMGIPLSMLPDVKPSSFVYGYTDIFGGKIPISGAAGDQQAALFGQTCFGDGEAKNTYGTGCFMLMNTGQKPVFSENGLLTTIAWGIDGKVDYALEGSVFNAGAAVKWLRDELCIISTAVETSAMSSSIPDTSGVYVVPAFTGLGAPHWNQFARGTIVGLTRGAGRAHIVRATLESLAYQTFDVLCAMIDESGIPLIRLNVDGGASNNDFLMQFQADISGCEVRRPACVETTALGAAYLAGLAVGFFESTEQIAKRRKSERIFTPQMSISNRHDLLKGWRRAVNCALDWAKEE